MENNAENMELLENYILTFCNTKYKDSAPTEKEFNDAADAQRKYLSLMNASVTDKEFEQVKSRAREYVVVIPDRGICLPNPNSNHKPWLASRKADIDFFFWNRYKKYLEIEKHWNPRVTANLGRVSDDILDMCGDPKSDGFHIRGLVLGDVQSGKTANYTAIANKAADTGYEIIIVLAGIPELLRQQTQNRLDEELCGRKSNAYLDPKADSQTKFKPVGVAKFGQNKNFAMFTSEATDFNVQVLKSNNLALSNVNCPILLVVKKNKTILGNLFRWLKGNNILNANGQIEKALLLIDDEADNASINTHNEDTDPTAINKAIRELNQLFSKSTYLAVTATPFANIFIDPSQPDDLFPSDFIYALDPPTNYIGAERIFGDDEDADCSDWLVRINTDEFTSIIPDKHKKELELDTLPRDVYDAANYFLLANAIRDIRGDLRTHRSMMIHISRFIHVQTEIAEIINEWLEQVKSDVQNYSQLSSDEAERIPSIHNLHVIWNRFDLERKSGMNWQRVLKDWLYRAIAPIEVRAVNSSGGSSTLDYDQHKDDGLRVIAVGGNTLSRGLTLEGLMVTYFYRNTNMYDTLMQMGRWFGYRPNYSDLVKIWMTQDAIDWYSQINEATQDLRSQIFRMKKARQSPKDFGLRVRQDPGSLIVTARNKMRTATSINAPINVSGHLLETPRLYASNEKLESNKREVEKFIDRLSSEGTRVPADNSRTDGNYFWENVSGEAVSELLDNFETHPWHLSYNGKALAAYVASQKWDNGWDVVLINHGTGKAYPEGIKCGSEVLQISSTESRAISNIKGVLSVSGNKLRVGSGGCARIGLTEEQIAEVKKQYREAQPEGKKKKSIPDSAYLIEGRNPILMIHIIHAEYEKKDSGFPEFLFGLGVGFPQDEKGNKTATYMVNLVELSNWIDPDSGEDA